MRLPGGKLVQVCGAGLGAAGTYAEKVAVPAGALRYLPGDADPGTAATVGVAGRTAWRTVHQLARVRPDDVVLVLGAAGGVGLFAAQLARPAGTAMLAHTADEDKARHLAGLGMESVVAATPDQMSSQAAARGVCVVLDPLGGDYLADLLPAVAPGARAVTYGVLAGRTARLDLATLYGKGITIHGTSGGTTSSEDAEAALTGALREVLKGDVAIETQVLPLTEAPHAFTRLRRRTVVGKLLLRP